MAKITRNRVVDTDPEDTQEETVSRPKVTRTAVSSGWGAKQEEREETVQAPRLVLGDNGTRIVKIHDAAPAVKYKRHYIRSLGKNGWYLTCLQTDCPLCKAIPPEGRTNLRASWTFIMNVTDMADDPTEVKTWTFGNEVSSQLQSIVEDKEVILNDEASYFEVKHVKVAGRDAPGTNVTFMRSRYIEEEHGLQPLNEDEIAELNEGCYGAEIVRVNDAEYLEDIVLKLKDTDFPLEQRKKS